MFIYDISEPIRDTDPPKIKALKRSYHKEMEADGMLLTCVLIGVLALVGVCIYGI